MESTSVSLKWAQRKKLVYLTLEAKNLSEEGRVINLTPEGHLHFEGTNKVTSAHYKLDLNLYDEVVVDTTKWKVTDYSVQFSISKKNENSEFWPRLTKEKVKSNFITIDWDRWIDEDEPDTKKLDFDNEGFDDLPDEDSDDEEEANLNDLEGETETKNDLETEQKTEEEEKKE
jgi:CS domain